MSEHTIDQHDIELPELPKDEDELRLDEIAEVIHDFLGTKESESLEAESATYSQEEQVIDRRIESQERVQALETDSGNSTPRPERRALQRANAVRSSEGQRRQGRAASYDPQYVQRATGTATELDKLTGIVNEAGKRSAEKTVDVYGASLDELFTAQLEAAGQMTSAEWNQDILDSLDRASWSADRMRAALRNLVESGTPGKQPADIIVQAVRAAEGLLTDLTAMSGAIGSSGAGLAGGQYFGIVRIVSVGVARTLRALADGTGILSWTTAQRCHDVASRLRDLSTIAGIIRDSIRVSVTDKGTSTTWSDAVTTAQKAVKGAGGISSDQQQALGKALQELGPDLDTRFDELCQAMSGPDGGNLIDLGWEFARLVNSLRIRLGALDLPAASMTNLQFTLAALADYFAKLVSLYGALQDT